MQRLRQFAVLYYIQMFDYILINLVPFFGTLNFVITPSQV